MRLTIIFGLILCLTACSADPRERITGVWQVDSTYNYYNGFDYTDRDEGVDWADCWYTADGKVKEIRFATYREYGYRIQRNELVWESIDAGQEINFEVLYLGPDHLVLKRVKPPMFPGNDQERYEIRYFSRTELSSQEISNLQPFTNH